MHKPVPPLLIQILFPAMLFGQASSARPTPIIGRYEIKWSKGAGCILKVQQLSDSLLRFQLDCSAGAPAYNTGQASGTLSLKNGTAVYSTTEWGERCEIRFHFSRGAVVVTQTGSDGACGFGHSVYSDGRYRLVTRKTPVFDESP